MAVAENLYTLINLEQAFLRVGQNDPAHKKLRPQGLNMRSREPTPGAKWCRPWMLIVHAKFKKAKIQEEKAMPIFEYVCRECKRRFETLVYGSQKAKCPDCGGHKLDAQLSVFPVSGKSSSASSPATGACGTCGDPRGPGSCAMPDFD